MTSRIRNNSRRPTDGKSRYLSADDAWQTLLAKASSFYEGSGGSETELRREFRRLVKAGNPHALAFQAELQCRHECSGPRISEAYRKGSELFRPFLPEMPFYRG